MSHIDDRRDVARTPTSLEAPPTETGKNNKKIVKVPHRRRRGPATKVDRGYWSILCPCDSVRRPGTITWTVGDVAKAHRDLRR